MREASGILWKKSSLSGLNGCVEVGQMADAIAIRNSRQPDGPFLVFSVEQWRAFLHRARAGEFDQL